jgi:hypothetical protein
LNDCTERVKCKKRLPAGLCCAVVFFVTLWASAGGTVTSWNDLKPVEKEELIGIASKGRYLEGRFEDSVTMDRWRGFPLKKYSYLSAKWGRLYVVLLDPTGEQAARWVVNAVVQIHSGYNHALAVSLAQYIRKESGFQFPVAGFVDEQKAGLYLFYDGIAVKTLKQLFPGKPMEFTVPGNAEITDAIQIYVCNLPASDIRGTGYQARPASISVEEFQKSLPIRGKTQWNPDVIRQAYQAAWRSEKNELISKFLETYPTGRFP